MFPGRVRWDNRRVQSSPESLTVSTPLAAVVGARTANSFARILGVHTVGDALDYFPRRWAQRGELTPIAGIPAGEHVTIVAEVVRVSRRQMRARKGALVEVMLTDGTGFVTATFFNLSYEVPGLKAGARGVFSGQVSNYHGSLQLAHPEFELFDREADEAHASEWADAPIPIYPATATLSSKRIARVIQAVLDAQPLIPEIVDERTRGERDLIPRPLAYEYTHRPHTIEQRDAGVRALRFAEAYVLQAAFLAKRAHNSAQEATARTPGALLESFDASLPWPLTDGQRAVGEEILADLARTHPMNRRVQGEVGSGKTVVALRAMLAVAQSGGQSALLAPTEVLASQHFQAIVDLLGPDLAARVHPVLVTGGMPQGQRKRAVLAAAAGQAGIVVGTHALLSDTTIFYDLGLVVVDEQHRFGVAQREALRAKSPRSPHVLMLTATPIPRTLAMTVFGDLDVSSLHEVPAGRQPVESFVVPLAEKPGWGRRVWQRLHEEVVAGRQGFVVCGLIDADEGGRASVEQTVAELAQNPDVQGIRLAGLTGRMSSAQKAEVMQDFLSGEVDVLVATTVVEVGVNVPNASIMVVLDADRFGISQLHQLRGRIGRGVHPGVVLFVTEAPAGSPARQRLDVVASTRDGFELAEEDFRIRQEGDVLGTAQSGRSSSLKLLRVGRDARVITQARGAVAPILEADPSLAAHPALADAVRSMTAEVDADYLLSS